MRHQGSREVHLAIRARLPEREHHLAVLDGHRIGLRAHGWVVERAARGDVEFPVVKWAFHDLGLTLELEVPHAVRDDVRSNHAAPEWPAGVGTPIAQRVILPGDVEDHDAVLADHRNFAAAARRQLVDAANDMPPRTRG